MRKSVITTGPDGLERASTVPSLYRNNAQASWLRIWTRRLCRFHTRLVTVASWSLSFEPYDETDYYIMYLVLGRNLTQSPVGIRIRFQVNI